MTQTNPNLARKLGELATETLEKYARILGEDTLSNQYVKDGKVHPTTVMHNDSMVFIQFISYLQTDYVHRIKSFMDKTFDKIENPFETMTNTFGKRDPFESVRRDFFESTK